MKNQTSKTLRPNVSAPATEETIKIPSRITLKESQSIVGLSKLEVNYQYLQRLLSI